MLVCEFVYLCCWLYVRVFIVRFYLSMSFLVLYTYVEAEEIIGKELQFVDSLGV